MDSSPFEENPRPKFSPSGKNQVFCLPSPARQLFPRATVSSHQTWQSKDDFLSNGPATPPPAASSNIDSLRVPTPASARSAVKIDQSNEIIRGDLNAARYELSNEREERQLENIRHNQELRILEQKIEVVAKRADAAESDRRLLYDKQKELSEKLQKAKTHATSQKQDLERQIRRLKSENNDLKDLVNDKQEEIDTQSRQYRRKIDEIETRCKTLEKSNAELRVDVNTKNEIIDDIQVKLEKRGSEVEGLETELLRVKAQTGDLETLKVLKKELSELVNYIKTLEGTNRRQLAELKSLRETNKSLELVEEEKRALENKVNVLDDVRQDLSAALVRLSILQDERATWESYFQSEGLEFDSPASMARALVEERIEKAVLLEKAGRSNPDIIQKEEVIGELQEELQVVRRELDGCKESLSKDNKARQRLERQRGLALREAQFLREQLKSFTTEESIHMEGSYDKQKTQHVQQLEELLEAYKTEMEKLKAEMLESGIEIVPEINKKRQLDESINDERLGELTRRNRQLQEEISRLERKETVLNKDINALKYQLASKENTAVRILELKDNPATRQQAIKLSQITALREENAALYAQLEGQMDSHHYVPRASLDVARNDIKNMEKVVAEKEKRMERLKQIWSTKSLEFREAVHSLLGWKLDFLPNGIVRLTHMFAGKHENQSIEFDGEKGSMKVAGGPDSLFHKEVDKACSVWVVRHNIPCLLASVLLGQYEKTNQAQQ